VTHHDAKVAKVIRESRWNVRHEYDANHTKRVLDRYCQEVPKEERQLLYGLGRRCRDPFNHVLHQPIARDKKIEMWENAFNHYCGDHSKCDHRAHHGYQWKNRDMPEAELILQRYLVEGSKIIQKVNALSGSTPANESFYVIKGEYTDVRLNFITSNLGSRCSKCNLPITG
jgi:hypothetical protein